MRLTVATALALTYGTIVLASPMKHLQDRQNNGDDDNDDDNDDDGPNIGAGGNSTNTGGDGDRDDAVIYSPANLTTLNPGSTFNFTYLCDDADCRSVRVALIQYIEVSVSSPSWGASPESGFFTDCHELADYSWQRWQIRICTAHCTSKHYRWAVW
jgi:hypothetical protein